MGLKTTRGVSSVLPMPREEYDVEQQRQMVRVIELQFNKIETTTPSEIESRRYSLLVG